MTLHTVSGADIHRMVPMSVAIEALRGVFIEVAEQGPDVFTMPQRQALADGAVLVMVARHETSGTAAVKSLSVQLEREPAIVGSLSWLDPRRSTPVVMEAEAVTTRRTGAVAGLATDLLAPEDADTMALLGSGMQAPDQVRAVHAVRPLRELRILSRSVANAQRLARTLSPELPETHVTAWGTESSDAVATAVADAAIVSCATSAREPVLALGDLAADVHVNAIGSFRPSMRELPAALVAEAPILAVEQRLAAMTEAGEIIHALDSGARSAADIWELGELLLAPPERLGRTVFKSVGTGMQDWAVARAVADRIDSDSKS